MIFALSPTIHPANTTLLAGEYRGSVPPEEWAVSDRAKQLLGARKR
jgi:hypothetical protein